MAEKQEIEEKTLAEDLQSLRKSLKITHGKLVYDLNPKAQPPVIQEMVLAQRHIEDARFRLKQAIKLASKKPAETE